MKTYLLLSVLPLAVACNKNSELATAAPNPVEPVKVAAAPPPLPELKQIFGVVQFQEKCPIAPTPMDCLKIVGGEDMNGSETFYLPKGETSFEIIPSEGKSKAIRVHTDEENSFVDFKEEQHVHLLARLDSKAVDGSQVIGSVRSIGVVSK